MAEGELDFYLFGKTSSSGDEAEVDLLRFDLVVNLFAFDAFIPSFFPSSPVLFFESTLLLGPIAFSVGL